MGDGGIGGIQLGTYTDHVCQSETCQTAVVFAVMPLDALTSDARSGLAQLQQQLQLQQQQLQQQQAMQQSQVHA